MKNLIHSILFVLMPLGLLGQNVPCVTCFEQNPSTVTITDPARYSEMVPCSSGTGIPTYQQFYQRNRFKWYENSPGGDWEFKIKQNLYPGGSTYLVSPVTSPFVAASSSTTFPYLRNLLKEDLNPDNLPADGWELIRQDFGFANYNNTGISDGPDNLTSTNEQPLSQIEDCNGTPTNQMCARPSFQQNIGYIVLYNKYSATLRVLGLVTTSLTGNFVYVRLEIPRQFGPNGTGYPTNANGLLALYDSPYRYPDQETRVSTVGVYAKKLNQNFFFADFQLAYDPCLCLFNSQMDFSFLVGTQSSLAGVGVNAGDNPQSLDLITGMWDKNENADNQYDAQSNMFGFQSTDAMALQLDKLVEAVEGMDPNKKNKWKEEVAFLKTTLKVGSSLAKKSNPKLALALDVTGYFVDYGSFLSESKPKIKPTTMAISGTVTTLAGSDVVPKKVRTPGSLNAGSVVQEFPTQVQSQTYSPIYNSAPGVVAILSQPKIHFYRNFDNPYISLSYDSDNGNDELPSGEDKRLVYQFIPESFKYIINPVLDVKSVNLNGSINFKHHFIEYQVDIDNQLMRTNSFFNSEIITDYLPPTINNNSRINRVVRKSPLLPLNCLGNLPIELNRRLARLTTYIGSPTLVVSFIIELNSKNSKNENVVIVQTFKLPLEIVNTADPSLIRPYFRNFGQFSSPDNGIPTELTINFPYTNEYGRELISAHNSIFISSRINNWNTPIPTATPSHRKPLTIFEGGNEIELKPGACLNCDDNLSGQPNQPIVLQIGTPYTRGCPEISPVNLTNIESFCNSGIYKSRFFASRFAENTFLSFKANEPTTSLGYPIPNPNSGKFSLPFSLEENAFVSIYLTNSVGMRVATPYKNVAFVPGEHTATIDAGNLEPGVYFITLQHDGFKQARKLVIVR